MQCNVNIDINKPKNIVWNVITDIKNCQQFLTGITALEIITQPSNTLIGLKWKETRILFGKAATETMWITEAKENEYYFTRAENHGTVYITKLALIEHDGVTNLSLTFTGEVQGKILKWVATCMGYLFKNSMKKMLNKELEDIKKFVEAQ